MGSSFKMDNYSVLFLFIVKCLSCIFTAQCSNVLLKIDSVSFSYLRGLSYNAYTSRMRMIQEFIHLHTLYSEGEIVLDEELR